MARKTNEEFLKELNAINPNLEPLSEYVKSSESISCRCNVCGTVWNVRPGNLLSGYGCPTCGLKKRAKTQSKDPSKFYEQMRLISPELKFTSEYIGAQHYISVVCTKCGHEWNALPTNLLQGKRCPICSAKATGDKRRRTNNEFKEYIALHNPDIEPLEGYTGLKNIIEFKCKSCGYHWKTSPSSIYAGHGCPRCSKNGIYTPEEFVAKMESINPQIEVLGEYQRSIVPVECRCKLCGHIWKARPNNLLIGHGCPKCFHSTTSFIEEAIYESLKMALGEENVISRDRKTIGSELDILIPSMNIAIEPGSWKWHSTKLRQDKNKREKCKEKNIRLITIYTDYFDAKAPFDKDCFVYRESFGYEKDLPVLKKIVNDILRICDSDYIFGDDDWNKISRIAYQSSRRRTTEEFKELLHNVNPNLTVLGEYTNAWNKIRVRCEVCGSEWEPDANSLLQGHGCRRCAVRSDRKKKSKSPQRFQEQLESINPNIQLISDYVSQMEYISCKCKICGNSWDALPGNLLKGKGCPACSHKKQGINKRKNPEQFQAEVLRINPNVELLCQYHRDVEHVQCKCKICGNTWETLPSSLLKGTGCPLCARKLVARKKYKPIIQLDTGTVFESIKSAAENVGTTPDNIAACLTGRTKTAKGFRWAYLKDAGETDDK